MGVGVASGSRECCLGVVGRHRGSRVWWGWQPMLWWADKTNCLATSTGAIRAPTLGRLREKYTSSAVLSGGNWLSTVGDERRG